MFSKKKKNCETERAYDHDGQGNQDDWFSRGCLCIDHPAYFARRRKTADRDWFDTACRVAHMRPRVLLESAAPHTVIALASDGYGIAVIPSTVTVPRSRVRAMSIVQRGAVLGRWLRIAWDPERFLAPYAQQFVELLAADCERTFPGREYIQRAPPLPQPKVHK